MAPTNDVAGTAATSFHGRPVLVVDPGMHTAIIKRLDADRNGQFLVTASEDKTVRIWTAANGDCHHTLRLPAGPENVGKANATAISPDGTLVAAAGWTLLGDHPVYLFERSSGRLLCQVGGLPEVINHLAFSPDGMKLVVTLGGNWGVRLVDLTLGAEAAQVVAADENYGAQSYGAAFDAVGRIAATGLDGGIRLYDQNLRLLDVAGVPGAGLPYGITFSPDGRWLAVGYGKPRGVEVFQVLGRSALRHRFTADAAGLGSGTVIALAWSADGSVLHAGGSCRINEDETALRSWPDGGRGAPQDKPLAQNSIVGIRLLPQGRLAFAAADPRVGVLGPDRSEVWSKGPVTNDFREQATLLAVSADGERVHFRADRWDQTRRAWDKSNAMLSLRDLRLTEEERPQDLATARMSAPGLVVEGWWGGYKPTLNGEPLPLDPRERARSLAITPDGARVALGTDWWLRMFDREGRELWRRAVPAAVCAVNVSGDGRLVVAAYEDGTIRWHKLEDGVELLAFLPLADRRRWVAWTPDGFHAAPPGAYPLLGWHLERGRTEAPETIPISDIPGLRRPDVLLPTLQELDVVRVVGKTGLAKARQAVQLGTHGRVPPGAQLHVLAMGVSVYNGANAAHLRLQYADRDALDLATVLRDTQVGLYAAVPLQILRNDEATRTSILDAFANLRVHMARGAGQDLAVVFFSGHGAVVDGRLYLLPHDVDARTPARIKGTAVSVDELRAEFLELAKMGRMLVLLDACRSGAMTLDQTSVALDATVLKTQLGAANVTVLTSSSGTELSREDPSWVNGAFTEVLLEALGGAADIDHNGLISVAELMHYLAAHVPRLTSWRQTPGIEVRFEGSLFAAGL